MVAQGQDTNHAACFFGSTQIAAVGSMNGSLYPGTARFADVPPRQNTGDWVFWSPGPYSVPIVVDRPLAVLRTSAEKSTVCSTKKSHDAVLRTVSTAACVLLTNEFGDKRIVVHPLSSQRNISAPGDLWNWRLESFASCANSNCSQYGSRI